MIASPTNLSTTLANSRAITLQWSVVASATRYLIWYSLDGIHWRYHTYVTTTTTTLSGASSSNYYNAIFENIGPERKIWFRVAACNSSTFELSDPAEILVTLPDYELAAPSNLAVTMIGTAGVKLTWTGTTYATKQYILQYRIDNGDWSNTGTSWTPTANSTSGTFPDTTFLPSLEPNRNYTFRLKTCISTAGSELGKSSAWTYSETVTTPGCELATPTNLAKTGTSPAFTWTWNTVPGATSYYVSGMAFTSSGGSSPYQVTSTNSYTSSYAYTGTRFTVTAFNKTTLQRSEASPTFVSDLLPTAITISATFKTATCIGLYVNHQTWFNYGTHLAVDYKKASDTEWIPLKRLSSSASVSPIFVDALEPGTTYQFRGSYVGFAVTVPDPTIVSITTFSSEFAKGFFSSGVTAGFVAAQVFADTVKFYHSTNASSFTLKSQVSIEKPCFHFREETNRCIVGGKGKVVTSTDFLNWQEIKALGTVRDIQYDTASDSYIFVDEKSRIAVISAENLIKTSVLGPFVPTNAGENTTFVVQSIPDFSFALTPNQTFVSF